jgi:putative tryptophan/tyrosine transport system substrate-binding protein
MKRREFIAGLGAATWPMVAWAQRSGQARRLGVLMAQAESDPVYQALIQAFRTRLQQLGWTDGDNLRIDYRWTAGIADRFRTAAGEIVSLKPEVILAVTTPSAAALRRETQAIPIVFVVVGDPVAQGFVASLAHPAENLTGFANQESSLGGKRLSLLKDAAPHMTRVSLMYNPTTYPFADASARAIEEAAPSYGVTTVRTLVKDAAEIDGAMKTFAGEANGGLMLLGDSFLFVHRDRIMALATEHRLPTIAEGTWGRSGALIAYGADRAAMFQGAAAYVDRILRGAQVSELPVQTPTKYELVINLKTAKALGLTIPETLLATADEVIQ